MKLLRGRRFLFLSLALHAFLFAALLRRSHVREEAPPPVLMVELSAGTEASAPQAAARHAAPVIAKAPVTLPLSALAPVHKPNLTALRPGEAEPAAPVVDEFSPFQASQDVLKGIAPERTGALAWVYRKTQYSVGYPEAFIRHDITGQTVARLVFDKAGKLRPDLLRVHSDSPYLRVYVYRALESAFTSESVPANLVRWPDVFEVFCYVRFSFAETSATKAQIAVGPGQSIVGNKLYLARSTVKSRAEKLKWDLGPLHGLLPLPIVGVDMTWFARKYDEHKHPLRTQSEADDLGPYRKDPLFNDGDS